MKPLAWCWIAVDLAALILAATLVGFAGAAPSTLVSVLTVLVAVRAGRKARNDQDDDDNPPPPPTSAIRLGAGRDTGSTGPSTLRTAARVSAVVAVLLGTGHALWAAARGRPRPLEALLVGASLASVVLVASCGGGIDTSGGATGDGGSAGTGGRSAGGTEGGAAGGTGGGGGDGDGGAKCAAPADWTAIPAAPCCYQAQPCMSASELSDALAACEAAAGPQARPILCVGDGPCTFTASHDCEGVAVEVHCCKPGEI